MATSQNENAIHLPLRVLMAYVFTYPHLHISFSPTLLALFSYNVTPLLSIKKLFLAHFGPCPSMYSLDIETGYKCTIFNGNTSYTTFSVYSISCDCAQLVSMASPPATATIGRVSSLTIKSRTFSRVHAVVPRRKPYLRSFSTRTLGIT